MPEITWPLPCLLCGRVPEPVWPDHDQRQPYGATTFTSFGHYGSTVFDEMGRRFLEANICDHCLRAKAKQGVIALGHELPPVREPNQYETWAPYEPDEDDEA
jgi:hypothetical protein